MDLHEWLVKTTASDIMVRDVITFDRNLPLASAAEVLLQERITGAPVVEADGTCVGVLSVTDIISAEDQVAAERRKVSESSLFHSNLALPTSIYVDKLVEVRDKIAPASNQPVDRFMSPGPVGVGEEAPLEIVLQRMVDWHIHRVLVWDEDRLLRGIITTNVVMSALLRESHGSTNAASFSTSPDF